METNLLKELSCAFGPSGFEDEVNEIILKNINKRDFIASSDKTGSLILKRKSKTKSPKIMLASHTDEIGFMVSAITSGGLIKFQPLGGWNELNLPSAQILIKTKSEKISGIIATKPLQFLKKEEFDKPARLEDMHIDIGASSKEEVENCGIQIGDPVCIDANFKILKNKNFLLSKAWDDRAGCAALVKVMEDLSKGNCPNLAYFCFTAQEEVGLRGAKTSSFMVDPDVALIVEGPPADDIITQEFSPQGKLGAGPQIRCYDPSMIANPRLKNYLVLLAEEKNIPYQLAVRKSGGTDGGSVHLSKCGVPTIVISMPVRYSHTPYGILNLDDFKNTVKLIKEFLLKFSIKDLKKITGI